MEINHWARLVSAKLVKPEAVNIESDLIILGHYGGFSTYKQDGWYGYAMKLSDFVAEFSGITDIIAGPGILVAGTGPTRTIALDGTSGGGTNFNVQPSGPIQVSKNTNPVAGNLITVNNLDTLNIHAVSLIGGLTWKSEWSSALGYSQDDVVWYEDPDTNIYYTYWAYNSTVPAGSPLPTAGQANNTYWARLGLEGPTGNAGYSTAIMKLYQWSTTIPTALPVDQSIYTWADGTFTSPSDIGSWSQTIPSSPNADETLWEISVQYTNYPTGTTEIISWAGSGPPKAIAYFGNTGTDGKSVLSDSGAPSNSLGEDGDFYIDTASANYTMYGPKAGGDWLANPTKNLKGPAGTDGQDGSITYSGAGFPDDNLGVAGDYYIDTTSANYTMYGPKLEDNDWTGVGSINLKGPEGAPGGAVVTVGSTVTGATYTLAEADASNLIKINTTSNNVVIKIPNNLLGMTNGSQVMFAWDQRDANQDYSASFGTFTLPDPLAGVTIKSANSMLNLRTQYSAATLIKISNTEYYLVGDIAPY